MTSVMRMKSAAAGYDHVINKYHFTYAADGQSDDTKGEDSLQLIPRKHVPALQSDGVILHEVTNMNNNKATELESIRRKVLNQGEVFDDATHSRNTVPVPVAWSPCMIFKSNPLLLMTPQKPSLSTNEPFLSTKEPFLSTKENILEPQSANKIPKPVAWSPGMKVQPDPNLFITPERIVGKKMISNASSDDINTTENGNLHFQSMPTKAKNSYSVRFDLPPSTSEDESKDPFSETDSPITIRGCDLDTEELSFESPNLKSCNFQKTYNPGVYSDDSSLDESVLNSLQKVSSDESYKNQTNSGITKSVSDNSSFQTYVHADFPNCTSGVTQSHNNVAKSCRHIEADKHFSKTGNKDTKISVSSSWPNRMKPKSNASLKTHTKVSHERKKLSVDDKLITKADHLSSPLTPAESPPLGSLVIREMKNHLLSTKYSYPFELTATAEDCEYEHVFARPEFNSTVAMREKLDTFHDQEVNVMKAVQATLARSEVKRSELNEKAAVYTNRMSRQFKNLVDLNTSMESLCERVVRMRTNKVASKRRAAHMEKKSSKCQRAPDLMEFFTSDLQKEYPDMSLPGVTPVTSQLMTSPHENAFDLYRHNRLWQGISDF